MLRAGDGRRNWRNRLAPVAAKNLPGSSHDHTELNLRIQAPLATFKILEKRCGEQRLKTREVFFLLCLTLGALLVHGYHPWAEDAEIYLPGIEKTLHPELFPRSAEFFAPYARLSLFHHLIAVSVRVTYLPLETALFIGQIASIFLLLLACWRLSGKCFSDSTARWAGVALIAALLTLPVAGTSLYILDQYINPRNLVAFAAVFAVVDVLEDRYIRSGLWLIFAASVHPLMAAFAFSYCFLLVCQKKLVSNVTRLAALLPVEFSIQQPSQAYHEAAQYHAFHYILRWQWYEWLGIAGPIPILWWFARLARTQKSRDFERMCHALIVYDLIYFAAALIISIPARFESLARIQPLRSLHLLYILLVLFSGGFLGEYILKNRGWRWFALFIPLCGGMFAAQRSLFPDTEHIEWPGAASKNPWEQAFLWTRTNTPADALFALDPLHMRIKGEDTQGFRAIAQRSMLADAIKDSGAVSMFPPLADEWYMQVQAQSGWQNFKLEDFRHLRRQFGVSWVVVQQPGVAGLDCPYKNAAVLVCRVD